MTRSTDERCRYCRRTLDPDDAQHRRHWPFCCDRCRMAELGHWFEERYVISRRADQVADDAARRPGSAAPCGGPGDTSPPGGNGDAPADGTNDNKT